MAIGRTYQPGSEQNGSAGGPSRPPVQEAVRLMSLRLPSVVGAQAPSPQSLIQGMGGAGLQGMGQGMSMGAALELLRRLIQQGGMGGNEGFGRVPSPRVEFPTYEPYDPSAQPPQLSGGSPLYPPTDVLDAQQPSGGPFQTGFGGPSAPGEFTPQPWPGPIDIEEGQGGIAPGEFNPSAPPVTEAGRRRPGGFGGWEGPY